LPNFEYKAIDSNGKEKSGIVEADDNQDAISKVKDKGLYPTEINQTEEETKKPSKATSTSEEKTKSKKKKSKKKRSLNQEIRIPFLGIGTVGLQDTAVFTRQLATMINAGLPLVRSLNVLQEQLNAGPLKNIVASLSEEVTTGGSLSEALTKYPKVFSPLYINMVKAGEAGGVLEIVLERLSTFMEKNLELGRKIKAALTYPALVVLFAGGVLLFLTVYLIPQFMGIFETLDVGKLPTITAVTMSISNFFQNQWYIGIGALIGLFVFYKALLKNEKAKYLIDKGKLRLPIAGDLLRKIEVTRFSRTLGTLISSGVPILQALRITEGVVNNKVISDAIGKVHNSIREGESIASPLKASGVFPLMVVNMVDVGEETGSLDEMFVKVADIYDSEVDTTVDSLTSIIEPVLIITMGLIVGFIVVSMFLPLIKLMTSIGMRA
jgi:type IV pilus assembly protein PilC